MWKYECVARQEFESIKDKIEEFIVKLGGNEVSVDLPYTQIPVDIKPRRILSGAFAFDRFML